MSVAKKAIPFIIAFLVALILITYVDGISLVLVNAFGSASA